MRGRDARLAEMERQRDELSESIRELRSQLKWGEDMIASLQSADKAAE